MELSTAALWWVVTGLLVAAELATGTFYLLMLALGAAAGALAAYAGATVALQTTIAALLGGVATAAWHWRQSRRPASAPAAANRDVNLDIGERVTVREWQPDGSARVQYRGAAWTAQYAGPEAPLPGDHFIVAIEGNRLVLARTQPTA